MNLERIEKTLYELAARELAVFGSGHRNTVFYGFAFDCNADYGEVLLCLNDELSLRAHAEESKSKPASPFLPRFDKMMREKYGIVPKAPYEAWSIEEIMEDFRWNPGDWKFQGFYNCSDDSEWDDIADAVQDEIQDEEDREPFLEGVCRVLIQLEADHIFDCLNCSPNFRGLVIDHDESIEKAWDRLSRVRKSVAAD